MRCLTPAIVVIGLLGAGCAADSEPADASSAPSQPSEPVASSAPDFTFHDVTDAALQPYFAKQVDVFGVPIVGTAAIDDDKVLHAAEVMAQYLDNDEDGEADDPRVVQAMLDENAVLVMFADFDELGESGLRENEALREHYEVQDLEGHETIPPGTERAGDEGDTFDGAIEEVWHLVSFAGYAVAYPDAFGPQPGSRLADAMDLARGGRFIDIPERYPEAAWYSYYDQTCEYECMAIEYVYWALSTHLGAQADPGRCEWIDAEWRPVRPSSWPRPTR